MKLRRRDFSIGREIRTALWVLLLLACAGGLCARPTAALVSRNTPEGPVIRFANIGSPARSVELLTPTSGGVAALRLQMAFDRNALGPEPLAIYTEDNRNRFELRLNGVQLYRDFAAPTDPLVTAYEPVLIPIPPGLLRKGRNEITATIFSRHALGAGSFEMGPQHVMTRRFGWMNLWRIDVPRKLNFAMLMLVYGGLVYWAFNRREIQFALIGVVGFLWCLSNANFLFESSPFGELALSAHPTLFLFGAAAATLVFAADFVTLSRRRWIGLVGGLGAICLLGARWLAPEGWALDAAAQLGAAALLAAGCAVAASSWRRSRAAEDLGLAVILALIVVGVIHDFGRAWYVHAWNGLGVFTRPYAGFVLCSAFLFSFGRRSASAFGKLRRANADLETRVAEARLEVAVSEARRRTLEVASAMEAERERLLREMHDGIGSNLVTALAIAEQQDQPAAVLHTLRRALSDLKITIDSLEPVEGDLVALLANLRHRMERDLRDAGLACRWRVAECRPLPWLDAANALHVLRIFQEAIGNALTHAGAATLEIGCHEEGRDDRDGVLAYVVDDGRGFDTSAGVGGKGLGNMRSRARALHGRFECQGEPDKGTRIALWLPYDRSEPRGRSDSVGLA